ncbi:MAG: glycosyltransferase family 2 protein [Candidatus Blackburnbacteria bacterium]|nr:glycosyltransferase family 2 protein [Candidatus Blackburnbacteria bacterium]
MVKVDLSIVILNYNSEDFLVGCIQSIREADMKGIVYEIIVVDNASTDGSLEEIRSTKFEIRNKFKIQIIQNEENLGFAKGNNVGVNKASGRYVLFLNPDTVVSKDAIKTVFKFMEDNSDVGVATARLELADGKLDESSHRGFPTPWNAFSYFSGLEHLFPRNKLFAGYTQGWLIGKKAPHEVDSIGGAFFFVRRKAAEEVGWWDEDYLWYGEDIDFSYKLKKMGWKVVFIPQVKVLHYRGVSSGIKKHSRGISTASKETKILAARASTQAMRIFYNKHYVGAYPRPLTWFVLQGIRILEQVRLVKVKFF